MDGQAPPVSADQKKNKRPRKRNNNKHDPGLDNGRNKRDDHVGGERNNSNRPYQNQNSNRRNSREDTGKRDRSFSDMAVRKNGTPVKTNLTGQVNNDQVDKAGNSSNFTILQRTVPNQQQQQDSRKSSSTSEPNSVISESRKSVEINKNSMEKSKDFNNRKDNKNFKQNNRKKMAVQETKPVPTSNSVSTIESDKDKEAKKEVRSPNNKEKKEEVVQYSKSDLAKLEKGMVFLLKKVANKNPKSKFYCRLCNYHCDTIQIALNHIKEGRHSRLLECYKLDQELRTIPPPSKLHVECMSELLRSIETTYGITEEELETRTAVVQKLQDQVDTILPGHKVRLYGSSAVNLASKVSDVNIDLHTPGSAKYPIALTKLADYVQTMSCYEGVARNFCEKVPNLTYKDKETGLICVVSIATENSYFTSKLLRAYMNLDPRARTLGIGLLHWAKLCGISDHNDGYLPSYAYVMMLVYYLQSCCSPPVLPVLNEIVEVKEEKKKGKEETKKEVKNAGDGDKNEEADASKTSAPKSPEVKMPKDLPDLASKVEWKSENKEEVGSLWLGFFKLFGLEFPFANSEIVICIRRSDPLTKAEKTWGSKRLAMEDPYLPKRNIARYLKHNKSIEFFEIAFKRTYLYFGYVQTKNGPLKKKPKASPVNLEAARNLALSEDFKDIIERYENEIVAGSGQDQTNVEEGCLIDLNMETLADEMEDLRIFENMKMAAQKREEEPKESNQSDGESSSTDVSDDEEYISMDEFNSENEASSSNVCCEGMNETPPVRNDVEYEEETVTKVEIIFVFDRIHFVGYKNTIVVCSICQKEGHTKFSCNEDALPPLDELPKMDKQFLNLLSEICYNITMNSSQNHQDIADRKYVVDLLQDTIRLTYTDARLELFGSSCNGFGMQHSDLDLCLTFEHDETGETINYEKTIETLADKLRRQKWLLDVIPITTAKVPIVKFKHRYMDLEGDISLYNTLAKHNTDMLRLYSNLDSRVKMLGYTLKMFARVCDIGDASKGSLSSYAYVLMVIYFLQQRKPPIIPVLQEVYDKNQKEPPKRIVDGCNAWFQNNRQILQSSFQFGKNTESVGQLWLGMLRFYTEDFNFKENVVCIRRFHTLTKFEKMWNSKCIAIEDPFDLEHNLGSGVSRNMNAFIMKAFIKGRKVFGTPIRQPPRPFRDVWEYLFSSYALVDNNRPPNDRGCRYCRSIGHMIKDCPRKNNRNNNRGGGGKKSEGPENNRKKPDDKKDSGTPQQQQQGNKQGDKSNNSGGNRSERRQQRANVAEKKEQQPSKNAQNLLLDGLEKKQPLKVAEEPERKELISFESEVTKERQQDKKNEVATPRLSEAEVRKMIWLQNEIRLPSPQMAAIKSGFTSNPSFASPTFPRPPRCFQQTTRTPTPDWSQQQQHMSGHHRPNLSTPPPPPPQVRNQSHPSLLGQYPTGIRPLDPTMLAMRNSSGNSNAEGILGRGPPPSLASYGSPQHIGKMGSSWPPPQTNLYPTDANKAQANLALRRDLGGRNENRDGRGNLFNFQQWFPPAFPAQNNSPIPFPTGMQQQSEQARFPQYAYSSSSPTPGLPVFNNPQQQGPNMLPYRNYQSAEHVPLKKIDHHQGLGNR